ncbi:glycosyltransferase family 2 protein [Rosistilla oblonga]|uniref:glycosyltransferase family 2 protein n=1 Tax=Rosistilla oblonga TaxID=2527990 RepID=UPI003A97B9C9
MNQTPVALFIFRRPDLTQRVFDAIAAAKPAQLLIVCDGARPDVEGEQSLVEQTQAVVANIDWPCQVHRRYASENLGCGRCISEGLQWVFETVEEAIILEDDCLPNPSFFTYCSEMLSRYRDNTSVMAVSGTNYFDQQRFSEDSYYFSKYFWCWGWASWSRAWKHYDRTMKDYSTFRSEILPELCESRAEFRFHAKNFDRVAAGRMDTWDYQCAYSFWRQRGLCIHPAKNLISNLGFRADGTHTGADVDADAWNAELPTHDLGPLRHPAAVIRNEAADRYLTQHALLHPPKRRRTFAQRLRRHGVHLAKSFRKLSRPLRKAA